MQTLARGTLARGKQLEADLLRILEEDEDLFVRGSMRTAGGRSDDCLLSWADTDRLDAQLFLLLSKKLPKKFWNLSVSQSMKRFS